MVGPSKYGAKANDTVSSDSPSEAADENDSSEHSDEDSDFEAEKAEKVPRCRRAVPKGGKGKGRGKGGMDKAWKAHMAKEKAKFLAEYHISDDEGDEEDDESDEVVKKTVEKPSKKRKPAAKKPTSNASTNPIGVGAARAKGKGGKGKGKRKGPGAAHLNRVENEPFSDDGEDVGNKELDEDFEEMFPIDVMPDLDKNAPREDDFGEHGVEDVVKFPDLEWGEEDDTTDRDRVLKGKPSWGGSEAPGTTRIPGASKLSLLQLFLHLFPLAALERIVVETNLYAAVAMSKSFYPNARKWEPLTLGEFLTWLSICIGMGVFQLQNYPLFWSGLSFGAFRFPDISKAMSLVRWEQIKRFRHLKSNVDRPPMDTRQGKLWQCEWLENLLTSKAKECWNPAEELCMDERSIPSRHKYNPIRVFHGGFQRLPIPLMVL